MKKKFYLTLDTETATLPFVDEICKSATQKQKVAIAKPLVYDIGWVVSDRKGNVIKTENFLVQETFFVPNVFNTAYYKEKRPVYMKLLEEGKIKVANWNKIVDILVADLDSCDLVTAYNACFDFKKAIPFTDKYIKHLYSADYNKWEQWQKQKCKQLLKGKDDSKNPDFLKPYFEIRGKKYPVADLWCVACEKLINNSSYKNFCLKNELLTTSAIYFKTSAETSFQYLMKDHDFSEDHTALSDSLIEMAILTKALKKGKVEAKLGSFPFRELGTTYEYVQEKAPKYKETVAACLKKYIEANEEIANSENAYWMKIIKIYSSLL